MVTKPWGALSSFYYRGARDEILSLIAVVPGVLEAYFKHSFLTGKKASKTQSCRRLWVLL